MRRTTRGRQSSYSDRLKDPRWQRKRLETLDSQGWECQKCGSKDDTLHVHHNYYLRGKEPWEYSSEQLTVLCEDCHGEVESLIKELHESLSFFSLGEIEFIVGVANATRNADEDIEIPCRSWEEAHGIAHGMLCRGITAEDVIRVEGGREGSIKRSTLMRMVDEARRRS